MPATFRDSRPSGLTARIASAKPGALPVEDALGGLGGEVPRPNPVPPVVTISPLNPYAMYDKRVRDVLDARRRTMRCSITSTFSGAQPVDDSPAAGVLTGARRPHRRTR